jgi:hypothetical protein
MDTFEIKSEWLAHQGGTKFYQTFLINWMVKPGFKHSCTVVHYSAYRGTAPSVRVRPVSYGQVKIFKGSIHYFDIWKKKQTKKDAQDLVYTLLGDGIFTGDSMSRSSFLRELTALFGAAKRDDILVHLGLSMNGESAEGAGSSDAGEDSPVEIQDKERPAAWGSW